MNKELLAIIARTNVKDLSQWGMLASGVIIIWIFGGIITKPLEIYEAPVSPKIVGNSKNYKSTTGTAIDIFGIPDIKKTTPVKVITAAKRTRLNLILIGIIDLGDTGVAIISRRNKTFIVSIGEDIQRGVKLLDIFSDSILIDNNGLQEKLMLLGEDKATKGLFSQKESKAVTASHVRIQRLELAKSLRKNPLLISKYLSFKPLRQGKKWIGLQIWPKNKVAIFNSLGFESGDILKKVEGKTIQDMSQNPRIWQKIMQRNNFKVEVERKGQLQTLMINLNK